MAAESGRIAGTTRDSVRRTPGELIREEIRELSAYHVPPSAGMVKLDAMENPYGLPQALREELAALVVETEINRYPDPGAMHLKARLRQAFAVPARAELLLGNGSDELIQMMVMAVARPGAVVLSVDPTFVMFRMIARFCGVRYESVALGPGFTLDGEAMAASIRRLQPAVVFVAYPNNPTGNLFDEGAMEQVLEAAPGLVVVDEAYHAFAGRSFMDRLGRHPNLLVMRTLSKSGLAGLRLGVLAGPGEWLAEFDKVRLPYNVNVLTQRVAEKVLQHQSLLDDQARAIRAERAWLGDALGQLPGVTAFPSDANFILFRAPAACSIHARLVERGILIKNLDGSHPALGDCLRVTVGAPAENRQFVAALDEILRAQS